MAGHADKAGLARDTVFAAAMIVCNGIVGLCLRVGGWRHYEQGFQLQGAGAALGVLAALTTLTMILPNVTTTVQGPVFSTPQLLFVAVVSLLLYGSFLFVQTVRHRDYFLSSETEEEAIHGEPPSASAAWASTGLLVVALVAVVALAKTLTPSVDAGLASLRIPASFSGIVIATLVLLPEGLAALRAAREPTADKPQSRIGIVACDYRPDDPGRRHRVGHSADAAPARTRSQGGGAPGADPASRGHHTGHRPDDGASRRRAPRHFRGVPILRDRAVNSRRRKSQARQITACS